MRAPSFGWLRQRFGRISLAALLSVLCACLLQCSEQRAGAQMQTTAAAANQSVAPALTQRTYSTRTYSKPSDEELK
jgi:hypothetical protein